MTLLLDDQDVVDLCDVGMLVDVLEDAFKEEAEGAVDMPPRLSVPMRGGLMRIMPVAMNRSGLFGYKEFHTSEERTVGYAVSVLDQRTGDLLAIVDGDFLTAARTGATAAVAAKYLARDEARSVAVIGSGLEARTNLAAMCAVRAITAVRVFSPRQERREAFAEHVSTTLGVACSTAESLDDCVEAADIIIVATNTMAAPDPIAFRGAVMKPGVHVSAIGSTLPTLREVDVETFRRADRIVVDAWEQMKEESGDVIAALAEDAFAETPGLLPDVVAGKTAGRERDDEITLFKSVGTGVQDVSSAHAIYQRALELHRGKEIGTFPRMRGY
jgi:ornithine cyclodeaminase/alanine dehydrogenase